MFCLRLGHPCAPFILVRKYSASTNTLPTSSSTTQAFSSFIPLSLLPDVSMYLPAKNSFSKLRPFIVACSRSVHFETSRYRNRKLHNCGITSYYKKVQHLSLRSKKTTLSNYIRITTFCLVMLSSATSTRIETTGLPDWVFALLQRYTTDWFAIRRYVNKHL
jgi:hypothetical protein